MAGTESATGTESRSGTEGIDPRPVERPATGGHLRHGTVLTVRIAVTAVNAPTVAIAPNEATAEIDPGSGPVPPESLVGAAADKKGPNLLPLVPRFQTPSLFTCWEGRVAR